MRQTIEPAERLLNLVIALVNTRARMTKEEIRHSVAGYSDTVQDDAFERMFERDKTMLRDLGIPIVTVDAFGHQEDVGYRIDMDSYALGAVEFTPAEFAVVGLAAGFWQDRALARDTTRALTKLRAASGPGLDTDPGTLLAPRVREIGSAYDPLMDAVVAHRAVTFTYRAAYTGQTATRTVEPWRIAARGGGWYLIGWDREREDVRVFRLSRIAGRVRAIGPGQAYVIPDELDVDALLGTGQEEPRTALLALRPERADALRVRGVLVAPQDAPEFGAAFADRDLLTVTYTNPKQMVREIAGFADAVVVLEPAELREAVVDRLRGAAAIAALPERMVEGDRDEASKDESIGSALTGEEATQGAPTGDVPIADVLSHPARGTVRARQQVPFGGLDLDAILNGAELPPETDVGAPGKHDQHGRRGPDDQRDQHDQHGQRGPRDQHVHRDKDGQGEQGDDGRG